MYNNEFLLGQIKKVNDYWIAQKTESGDASWERGAYMLGNLAAYEATGEKRYLEYAHKWIVDNEWKFFENRNAKNTALNGDSMIAGDSYLKLLEIYGEEGTDKYILEEMENLVNNPEDDDWWWVDAVYMAFAFLHKMSVKYKDDKYSEKAYRLFNDMRRARKLYDEEDHLWYRDDRFTPDKELTSNGKKIFWGRGNGWVFAGLARGLDAMGKDCIHYEEYKSVFCDMAKTLKSCVNDDGGFTTSLFDKAEFPQSETSGTALCTLGFLIGVRLGLLDESYLETAIGGFEWINKNAVEENGRIGYVQGISWGPDMSWAPLSDEEKKKNTNDYAVGTYLLICSELIQKKKRRNEKMKTVNLGLGGGKLIQAENKTLTQMMSYIIDCPNGGCIVIDGGFYCEEDAMHLYNMLCERGKKVDYWFITHAHNDHYGAMLYLAENEKFDIEVKNLCFNFPSWEWLSEKEDADFNERFLKFADALKENVVTVNAGDIFEKGGISVEVLSVPEEYENYPNINSTSIILRVSFPDKDVLFLGDFDEYAEAEFLRKHDAKKLDCGIVQMAHHGQNGVTEDFYKLIKPEVCLYTAPQWLWENNYYRCTDPNSRGKGPFTIMETRKWMEELGVKESYTHADGDIVFE